MFIALKTIFFMGYSIDRRITNNSNAEDGLEFSGAVTEIINRR
jgi:hypothetical protein